MLAPLVTEVEVQVARRRIAALVDPTPVVRSPELSRLASVDVWLKLENLQPCGSFKIRGAANRMLRLDEAERRRGVVTCSGGNHGAAVAYIAGLLGISATVCVPENVDPVKLREIRRFGAQAVVQGSTFDESVEVSRRLEVERGLTYIHPFDDPEVIAGQGTIALEVLEQVPELAAVATAVSGGGLAGGVGAALAARRGVQTIGVSAEHASTMAASLRAGQPVDVPYQETLAEVLTGGIGLDNRWSFAAVQRYVDAHVLVDETHIAQGMALALERHRMVVEGGGAVPIAAVLAGRIGAGPGCQVSVDGPLVLVVSGGNVDVSKIPRT